jgi:outer membrane protein
MSRLLRIATFPLILSSICFAQSVDSTPMLTLEECISRALDQNFTLQIQRYTNESSEAAVAIADADYDPTLTATARTGVSQQAQAGSRLDGVTVEGPRSETTNVRIGASQKIITGATVQVSANVLRAKTNSNNSLLNPAYDSDLNVSVSQPLLRGFGSAVNRAAMLRARLGLERADMNLKGTVLDVVRNVEAAYYNLAFAREQLGVRVFSRGVAQKLLEENVAKKETGVATDLEVLQAQVGVANADRNVLLAQQRVSDGEDDLINLMGRFSADNSLGRIDLGEPQLASVSFDLSYKLARDNWPDYAASLLTIEQLRLDQQTAKNNRKPSLNLGAGVGLNSKEGAFGSSTSSVWNGDGYSWQVDLALNVPWGFREEKARYAQATANLGREETRLQQIEQTILVDVRSAIRAVDTSSESLRISRLATQLSEQQFALEKARFDAGLSTFRRVQEAQEDLDTARVNEIQASVNLRIAQADLSRLEASSLSRYNITLE